MTDRATELPNFVIAGAQKCGTTSLYEYLRGHPECAMSVPKEPAFFCRDVESIAPYSECFAAVRQRERAPKAVGEASVAYMAHRDAPKRIRDVLGADLKIVLALRSPTDRAVSAYWHIAKRGDETRTIDEVFDRLPASLDEACAQEERTVARLAAEGAISVDGYRSQYDEPTWEYRYLANGRYAEALARFRAEFAAENLHIVVLEELRANPERTVRELFAFLDLAPDAAVSGIGEVHNPTALPRRGPLAGLLRRVAASPATAPLRGRAPDAAKSLARRGAVKAGPQTSSRLKASLASLFSEENRRLSELLSIDLDSYGW